MTAPASDLIAVADASFLMDEGALKRLAMMFDRIATPPLSILSNNTFETDEFKKTRVWLAETGILFEPNMDKDTSRSTADDRMNFETLRADANVVLNSQGASVEEFEAARGDRQKLAELKQRTPDTTAASAFDSSDPLKFFESIQRLCTNLTRIQALQLRSIEHVDAYAVVSGDFSSLDQEVDEQAAVTDDVLKIVLALPAPDEQVSWEQIIDYRNDADSRRQFLMVKNCLRDIARHVLTPKQVEETLEYLVNRYHWQMELHEMQTSTTRVEAFIVSEAKAVAELPGFGWNKMAQSLFAFERRKLTLLEGESTTPGSEVAYVMDAKSDFAAS